MGLPNATSVQQEMGALYGPFKLATYTRGDKVVQEKLRQQGLARRNGERLPKAVLILAFADLPTISTVLLTTLALTDHLIHTSRRRKLYGRGARLAFCHLQEVV
jgi:hypothetical protein